MKQEDLYDALVNIDGKYVEEAEAYLSSNKKLRSTKKTIVIIIAAAAVLSVAILTVFNISARHAKQTVTVQTTPGPDGKTDVIQYEITEPVDYDDPGTWDEGSDIWMIYKRGTEIFDSGDRDVFVAFSTYPTELDNYSFGSLHHTVTFVLKDKNTVIRAAADAENVTECVPYAAGAMRSFNLNLISGEQTHVFEVFEGGMKSGVIEITFEKGNGISDKEFFKIKSVAGNGFKVTATNFDYENQVFF